MSETPHNSDTPEDGTAEAAASAGPAAPEAPEAATAVAAPVAPAAPVAAAPTVRRPRRGVAATVAIVVGALIGIVALALLAGGGAGIWADTTQRDADGYFSTRAESFSTGTFALTHEGVDLSGVPSWVHLGSLGSIRIDAKAPGGGKPLFVGIAPQAALNGYLGGVEHDLVESVETRPFQPSYSRVAGTRAPAAPGAQSFWAARASGTHPVLTWHAAPGTWGVVVMNADGSRTVVADIKLAARVSFLRWVAIGLAGAGLLLLAISAALLWVGARRPRVIVIQAAAPPPPPAA